MGRMLESLKHNENRRIHLREKHFFEDSLERDAHKGEEPATPDEVPFVEVGPNKSFEASAHIMAIHPPQLKVQPPHAPKEMEKAVLLPKPALPAIKPMNIAYEPWPTATQGIGGIAPEIITHHQPDHAISRHYGDLVEQILSGHRNETPVLLFSAGRGQIGASTAVLNLAVAAGRKQGLKVVVIDAQNQKPGVGRKLGLEPKGGLPEVLAGKLALEQAVVATSIKNLHVLPTPMENEARVRPEAIHWMMGWLRENFDLVLIDGPTLETPSEVALWNAGSDGLYLVLAQGDNSQSQRSQVQAMPGSGGRLCGVIHTHVEV